MNNKNAGQNKIADETVVTGTINSRKYINHVLIIASSIFNIVSPTY